MAHLIVLPDYRPGVSSFVGFLEVTCQWGCGRLHVYSGGRGHPACNVIWWSLVDKKSWVTFDDVFGNRRQVMKLLRRRRRRQIYYSDINNIESSYRPNRPWTLTLWDGQFEFNNLRRKVEVVRPKNGGQNFCFCSFFSTTLRLDSEYLLNETWHRESSKGVEKFEGSPTSAENFVNFDLQTGKIEPDISPTLRKFCVLLRYQALHTANII